MQDALHAVLNPFLIKMFSGKLKKLYEEANFNEKAKFARLQKMVKKISDLATKVLFH